MPATEALLSFALVALVMVCTPGPNMVYLISRSICQGRRAGLISLVGVAVGFLFYMICAALGLTALLLAVPFAYDAIRLAGACYLLYLAWQTLRPGGRSIFINHDLPADSPRRLFIMGLLTNLLNPKAAVLYLSLLPQFVRPELGNVLSQSMVLGSLQILISLMINAFIIVLAGQISVFLIRRPGWQNLQRWIMGSVLGLLAIRMAASSGR